MCHGKMKSSGNQVSFDLEIKEDKILNSSIIMLTIYLYVISNPLCIFF